MTTDHHAPAAQRTAEGVQRMFDRVAPRYDLANTVFSLGQDKACQRGRSDQCDKE